MTIIDFEEASHTYRIDGQIVPSVTQCLSLLDPFAKVDRNVLEAARIFGQHGHKAMALYIRDQLDFGALDPALAPYVRGGIAFLKDFKDRTVIASELVVGSKFVRCAGTIDVVMEHTGGRFDYLDVVEFKFTAQTPASAGPQTAAYVHLLRQNMPKLTKRPIRRWCAVLKPDDYRLERLNDPSDLSMFMSCLNVTLWKIKHGI